MAGESYTPPGFRRENVLRLCLVLSVFALAACSQKKAQSEQGFRTVAVSRGELRASVSATGTVRPLISVAVGSQVSGIIASIGADFNSTVRKGDVIARIEPSLFKARLAEAEAKLKRAEAAHEKTELAVQDARKSLERIERLHARDLASAEDLDQSRFARDSALVESRVASAEVAEARAAVLRARVDLTHTTIYAPIDGVVISRDVDVAQTVAASLQAPTLFTIARDLRRMQIETAVDEAFIGSVREGRPVSFTVFAYPDRAFYGRVRQIRLNPSVEAGVVKYNCVIGVENPDGALKPGMTATVRIETEVRTNVLKVRNDALRFVPPLQPEELNEIRGRLTDGRGVLWTVADDRLRPIIVDMGLVGEEETEIRGEGLHEGMTVAVAAPRNGKRKRRFGLRLF